jgi:hypothetical protein
VIPTATESKAIRLRSRRKAPPKSPVFISSPLPPTVTTANTTAYQDASWLAAAPSGNVNLEVTPIEPIGTFSYPLSVPDGLDMRSALPAEEPELLSADPASEGTFRGLHPFMFDPNSLPRTISQWSAILPRAKFAPPREDVLPKTVEDLVQSIPNVEEGPCEFTSAKVLDHVGEPSSDDDEKESEQDSKTQAQTTLRLAIWD